MTGNYPPIFLSLSFENSSVYQYFEGIALEFCKKQHSVHLFFDKRKKPGKKIHPNVNYHLWPSRRPTHIKDFIFLNKKIKEYKPGVLIGNFSSVNIFVIAGVWNKIPNRIAWYHTLSLQIEPYLGRLNLNKKLQRFRKKIIYKLCTHIICNSKETRSDFLKLYGNSEEKVSFMPLLISDPYPKFEKPLNKKKTVLCVGRMHFSKGQDILLSQIPMLAQTLPQYKFIFAGGGPFLKRFMKLATQLNIEKRVQFMGELPKPEISKLMLHSEILVCPSRFEAFGLVNLEALAAGTPVVAFSTGGIPSIIQDGKEGILIEPENSKSLGESIKYILENPKIGVKMGKTGRQKFEMQFEISKNIEKQVAILQSILT